MALNDDAVVVAAQGFVYIADVGTAAPTPAELDAADPENFGAQVQSITLTGSPTGGTITIKVGSGTPSAPIPFDATPDQFQAAIEGLTEVGLGNTSVSGVSLDDVGGLTFALVEDLQGKPLTFTTVSSSLVGGTTPTAVVAVVAAPNGWNALGHTSRGKMPEFGFDGGKLAMKGTWQKERLREIRQGDPVEDSLKVTLEQWDADTLELYFGPNASETPGVFGVDGNFANVYKAFLVFIVDGDAKLGFYAPKAQVQRDASVDMPIDDFAGLPIEATFLNLGSRRLYDWISLELFS